MPRALFGYLLRGILGRLALAVVALTLLYLAFDLGDQGRQLAASLGWARVVGASLCHVPLVVVQILPAALLISAVLAFSALRSRSELVALASVGVAPVRLCLPLAAAGLLCTLAAAGVDELLVPPCEQRADRLYRSRRPSALTGLRQPAPWVRHDRWFLRMGPSGRLLALEVDQRFRPVRRVEAVGSGSSVPVPPVRAMVTRFNSGEGFTRRRESVGRLPGLQELRLAWEHRVRAEALDAVALYRRLHRLERAGQAPRVERLVLHAKLGFPLLNLVVALLGCSFVLGLRRATPVRDLLTAAALIAGLWASLATGWTLGRTGHISAAAGIWAPLGVALALGLAATVWRLRRAR